jgi:ketosteroid isomerase-like protein
MRPYVFMLALIVLLLAACQPVVAPSSAAPEMTEEEAFLAAVWEAEEAFATADADRLAEVYADDAVSFAPGYPPSVGKEVIMDGYRSFFEEYELDREFSLADYEFRGDFGTRTGEWTQVITPKAGGDSFTEVGRCILGFKKIDGEWKEVWEIYNTY